VCVGFITLLVIIYKGHSPSLVHARSQEVLEVIFARALCYTGLTGEAHRSDRRHLWSLVLYRSDRLSPPVWPMERCQLKCSGEKEFNLVVTPIHPPLGGIKVLSLTDYNKQTTKIRHWKQRNLTCKIKTIGEIGWLTRYQIHWHEIYTKYIFLIYLGD
jgi:hypothetical protein